MIFHFKSNKTISIARTYYPRKCSLFIAIGIFLVLACFLGENLWAESDCSVVSNKIGAATNLQQLESSVNSLLSDTNQNIPTACHLLIAEAFLDHGQIDRARHHANLAKRVIVGSSSLYKKLIKLLILLEVSKENPDLNAILAYYDDIKNKLEREEKSDLSSRLSEIIGQRLENWRATAAAGSGVDHPTIRNIEPNLLEFAQNIGYSQIANFRSLDGLVNDYNTAVGRPQSRHSIRVASQALANLQAAGLEIGSVLTDRYRDLQNYYSQFEQGRASLTFQTGCENYRSSLENLERANGTDTENVRCHEKRSCLVANIQNGMSDYAPDTASDDNAVRINRNGVENLLQRMNELDRDCHDEDFRIFPSYSNWLVMAAAYYNAVDMGGAAPTDLEEFFQNYRSAGDYADWIRAAGRELGEYYHMRAREMLYDGPGTLTQRNNHLESLKNAFQRYRDYSRYYTPPTSDPPVSRSIGYVESFLTAVARSQIQGARDFFNRLPSSIRDAWGFQTDLEQIERNVSMATARSRLENLRNQIHNCYDPTCISALNNTFDSYNSDPAFDYFTSEKASIRSLLLHKGALIDALQDLHGGNEGPMIAFLDGSYSHDLKSEAVRRSFRHYQTRFNHLLRQRGSHGAARSLRTELSDLNSCRDRYLFYRNGLDAEFRNAIRDEDLLNDCDLLNQIGQSEDPGNWDQLINGLNPLTANAWGLSLDGNFSIRRQAAQALDSREYREAWRYYTQMYRDILLQGDGRMNEDLMLPNRQNDILSHVQGQDRDNVAFLSYVIRLVEIVGTDSFAGAEDRFRGLVRDLGQHLKRHFFPEEGSTDEHEMQSDTLFLEALKKETENQDAEALRLFERSLSELGSSANQYSDRILWKKQATRRIVEQKRTDLANPGISRRPIPRPQVGPRSLGDKVDDFVALVNYILHENNRQLPTPNEYRQRLPWFDYDNNQSDSIGFLIGSLHAEIQKGKRKNLGYDLFMAAAQLRYIQRTGKQDALENLAIAYFYASSDEDRDIALVEIKTIRELFNIKVPLRTRIGQNLSNANLWRRYRDNDLISQADARNVAIPPSHVIKPWRANTIVIETVEDAQRIQEEIENSWRNESPEFAKRRTLVFFDAMLAKLAEERMNPHAPNYDLIDCFRNIFMSLRAHLQENDQIRYDRLFGLYIGFD